MGKPNNTTKPKSIIQVSLADQVEVSLRHYFKENKLSPGDPLPKEIELAESLGVSRNIVREALSRLRMLGIVESKKRKGMVLAEPDLMSGLQRVLDPGILGGEAMQDIFELRLVLEVGMSDLLFYRKKPEDLDELEGIARRESNDPATKSLVVRLNYEIEFHGKLYEMSGNETLRRFQSMLLPVFNYMREIEAKMEQKPQTSQISHFDLIETLRSGTPEEFRENMREHLKMHFEKAQNK